MSQQNTFSYSTVTGYFLQDEEATIAEDFDYVLPPSLSSPPSVSRFLHFA